MYQLKKTFAEFAVLLSYPKNILLLAVRWLLAYGFATPALLKINDLSDTQKWFETLSIPFPTFFSYLVSGIETMGIVLLVLGLFTRYVSMLLACVMIGAIFFVHIAYGFDAANNGIEIPLYYSLFLWILVSHGAGKFSIDALLFKEGYNE